MESQDLQWQLQRRVHKNKQLLICSHKKNTFVHNFRLARQGYAEAKLEALQARTNRLACD
jgi:hypothetical protein